MRDPKFARLVKLTGTHPRDAAAEKEAQDDKMHARGAVDPSYVALISVEGSPVYDSITGKLLDELVLRGMMKEHEPLESFGTCLGSRGGGQEEWLCGDQRKMGARRAR